VFLTETFSKTVYVAREHDKEYRPPESIAKYRALSRDVPLNGERTPFYFGEDRNGTRVNFKFQGTWWHITLADQPTPENLYPLLRDLQKDFNFDT
jgi:hypothetical protein